MCLHAHWLLRWALFFSCCRSESHGRSKSGLPAKRWAFKYKYHSVGFCFGWWVFFGGILWFFSRDLRSLLGLLFQLHVEEGFLLQSFVFLLFIADYKIQYFYGFFLKADFFFCGTLGNSSRILHTDVFHTLSQKKYFWQDWGHIFSYLYSQMSVVLPLPNCSIHCSCFAGLLWFYSSSESCVLLFSWGLWLPAFFLLTCSFLLKVTGYTCYQQCQCI